MLGKALNVKVGSELYNKVKALEDLTPYHMIYGNLGECLALVSNGNLMGGEAGEFVKKLMELREEVRDELNRHSNRIMGIDEDTEITIG